MSKKENLTHFPNKIGLFVNENDEVVLNFPYKDCVLEAGMTKEDSKREKEYFLHNDRDATDIATLFAPKNFTNFKKIDKNGEKILTENDEMEFWDEAGDLKQNLLVKGNNLVALHSLATRLAGKVKLIYIDPPYNTGNDGFSYNDRYSHSTWLTFMKNRLEIARELLREDGVIFVQCDDNEQAYLKVLMDEIFGRENFVNCIAVKMSEATGVKMAHTTKRLPKKKEYIFLYKKQKIFLDDSNILVPISEWGVNYKIVARGLTRNEFDRMREIMNEDKVDENLLNEFNLLASKITMHNFSDIVENWNFLSDEEKLKWKYDNAYRILRIVSSASAKKLLDEIRDNYEQDYFGLITNNKKLYFVTKNYNQETADPNIKFLFAIDFLFVNPCDFWDDIKTTRIDFEGEVVFKNGKKPEKILKRIIDMTTEEGDLVLDYHLGSGTTAAVAHKMGRRWIGIEQMDYIDTIAKERLKKVIDGEQGGISKSVNWQGGGDFVYFELKTFNADFAREIENATTKTRLNEIYQDMKRSAFLKFFFNPDEFEKEETDEGKRYSQLSLEEQKEKLIAILDMNHIYLNLENNNAIHDVSETDKFLTRKFYGKDE